MVTQKRFSPQAPRTLPPEVLALDFNARSVWPSLPSICAHDWERGRKKLASYLIITFECDKCRSAKVKGTNGELEFRG